MVNQAFTRQGVVIPFRTIQTLYDMDLVRRWYLLDGFLHFALAGTCLVAVYASEDPTKPHLVNSFNVGYVTNPEALDFPQWRQPQ